MYSIFLDLYKAYGALDRDICLEILEGYGFGPQARRFLCAFWDRLEMVDRASGYYGVVFQGFGGMT